jgi:hypothetical protein
VSRTSVCIAAAWALLAGLVVGWLAGRDLGVSVGEQRTINCTLFCQRGAAQEYGVVDLDSDCTCYGDVRALVAELDHAQVDTGWSGQRPAVEAP